MALLKCTSAYPSPPESVNLRAIPAMAERWGVPIGLSDHTMAIGGPGRGGRARRHAHREARDPVARRRGPGRAVLAGARPSSRRWSTRSGRPSRRWEPAHRARRRGGESRRLRRSLFVVEDVAAGEPFDGTERPLDPPGGRDAHPRVRGGARPARRGGDQPRDAAEPELLEPRVATPDAWYRSRGRRSVTLESLMHLRPSLSLIVGLAAGIHRATVAAVVLAYGTPISDILAFGPMSRSASRCQGCYGSG